MTRPLGELMDLGDLDELLREVDRCCDAADWDRLLRLAELARAAHERGRQLWPAASFAEYRAALEAPAEYCAEVVAGGAGYLASGPLTEVAAQRHTFVELSPHLPDGLPARSIVAHERVLRGETLDPAEVDGTVLDLPVALQSWEPDYPLAEYRPNGEARFPGPDLAGPQPTVPAAPTRAGHFVGSRDADAAVAALTEAVSPWTRQSSGWARAVGGHGNADGAVAALTDGPARVAPIDGRDALALLAWAAASGGVHGRRRGMAAGRFEAWWVAAHLAGLEEDLDDPGGLAATAEDLGDAVGELHWYRWWPEEPERGWVCRIAVEDPDHGLVWALDAGDRGDADA